jgi:hypothetical protein
MSQAVLQLEIPSSRKESEMLLRKCCYVPESEFNNPRAAALARLQKLVIEAEHLYPQLRKTRQWKNLSLIFTDDPDALYLGRAWQSSSTIEINLHDTTDLMDTVGHELVHIMAPLICGEELKTPFDLDDDHRFGWVLIMNHMGLNPKLEY